MTLIVFTTLLPSFVSAFPFGGQASIVVPCYNQAIYANLGPPRGGPYIWTPATRTYQFGPPSFAGQWLLGLASAPYFCVVSIEPVIVWAGTAIDMMGSSGSAAPTIRQLLSSAPPTTAAPPPIKSFPPPPPPASSSPPTTIGHVVVSEVYVNVDSAHGTKPTNQWIELFNGSAGTVDVSGWKIQNASAQTAIPPGATLASGQFLVVLANANTTSFWGIPATAKVVSLGSPISGGFSSVADAVILKNSSGVLVDAVSWGANISAFNPSVAAPLYGYSLSRKTLVRDTDSADDWTGSSIPSPGTQGSP